eukprot:1227304-Pleurochrysis_carterae.AAC.1
MLADLADAGEEGRGRCWRGRAWQTPLPASPRARVREGAACSHTFSSAEVCRAVCGRVGSTRFRRNLTHQRVFVVFRSNARVGCMCRILQRDRNS